MVRLMALTSGLTTAQARVALDAFVEAMKVAAEDGEDVTIPGFGKFTVRERGEAVRENPKTKEKIVVPPRKTVTFKASQSFRDQI